LRKYGENKSVDKYSPKVSNECLQDGLAVVGQSSMRTEERRVNDSDCSHNSSTNQNFEESADGAWARRVSVRHRGKLECPHLVIIVVRALPSLYLVTVRRDAVVEVGAEPAIFKRDAVVIGPMPLLSWKVVVALPDLQLDAVRWSAASIQTEVSPRDLDLSASPVDEPLLGRGTVTVVDLHRRSVLEDSTLYVQALVLEEVPMEGVGLVREIASWAERDIICSICRWAPVVRGRRGGTGWSWEPCRWLRECSGASNRVACNGRAESVLRRSIPRRDGHPSVDVGVILDHII
jgi:hypothetical protein